MKMRPNIKIQNLVQQSKDDPTTIMQYFSDKLQRRHAAKIKRQAAKIERDRIVPKGVLWGDIVCYEPEEWDECKRVQERIAAARQARQDAPSCDKLEVSCDKHGMSLLDELGEMKRQTADEKLGPEWTQPTDEVIVKRATAQHLPFDFVKCLNCAFIAHTNPPAHFTEKDIGFCCSLCRIDGRHGGQCQKFAYV
jgi:hypothetical protein